jgi:hypothetical protein
LDQANWRWALEISEDVTIRGRKFPQYTWKPLILAQPAMIGHIFDEFSSGVWRPEEHGDFLSHQSNSKFIYIGQGYPFGAANLTNSPRDLQFNSIDYIKELAEKIRTGQAPAGKIYTCSIFMRDDFQFIPMELLRKTLDALQDLARSGRVVYQDYESVVQIWRTRYHEQPNRFGIENFSIYQTLITKLEEFRRNPRPPGPPGQGRMPGMGPPGMGPPGMGPPDPGFSPPGSSGGPPSPRSAPD